MRLRHNKKRNTAFLYEMLVKHCAIYSLKKNKEMVAEIKNTIKKYFRAGTPLGSELALYKTLNETHSADSYVAQRLVLETKNDFDSLDRKIVFNEQTKLINWINKTLTRESFNVFVPSYKNLATISQIFNGEHTAKERVLLEKRMVASLMSKPAQINESKMVPMDDLVYKTVISNFNKKYDGELLDEQKELLKNYVLSFADNGIGMQKYLNEEISRIKNVISSNTSSDIADKLAAVTELIESFKRAPINDEVLTKIVKLQSLVKELQNNGNNN